MEVWPWGRHSPISLRCSTRTSFLSQLESCSPHLFWDASGQPSSSHLSLSWHCILRIPAALPRSEAWWEFSSNRTHQEKCVLITLWWHPFYTPIPPNARILLPVQKNQGKSHGMEKQLPDGHMVVITTHWQGAKVPVHHLWCPGRPGPQKRPPLLAMRDWR